MLSNYYKSNELIFLIQSLIEGNATGVFEVKTELPSNKSLKSCSLVLRDGNLIFAGSRIPSGLELCQMLGKKINPDSIDAALSIAEQRLDRSDSHQKFLDLGIKMAIFTEEDIEAFIIENIILNLEVFSSFSGEYKWQATDKIELFIDDRQNNISWSHVKLKLEHRRQKWESLMPAIPKMDAIPYVLPEQLQQINDSQVKKHFTNLVDGNKNLLDIAEKLRKDPYKVAKTYYGWAKTGWVNFKTEVKNRALPIVLSVDDSPIVQVAIKRSLEEFCQVILTSQASEAMTILTRQTVDLLLLDLTMPDIDGLEFCYRIRQIPDFKDLPIVMVTARDGLVNKAKGHLAGTNKYLTKPFKPEELKEVVDRYINN